MSSSSYTEFNSSMFLSNLLNDQLLLVDKKQKEIKDMPIFEKNTKFFLLNKKDYEMMIRDPNKTFIENIKKYNDGNKAVYNTASSFKLEYFIYNGNFYNMSTGDIGNGEKNIDDYIALLLNDLSLETKTTDENRKKFDLKAFNNKITLGNFKNYIILYTKGTIDSKVTIKGLNKIPDNPDIKTEIKNPLTSDSIYKPPYTYTYEGKNTLALSQIDNEPQLKFNSFCRNNGNNYLQSYDTYNKKATQNNFYTENNDKTKGKRGCYEYFFNLTITDDTLHELTENNLLAYLNRCEIYNTNSNCGGDDTLNCEYCKNIAYRDWYSQNNAKKIPILGNYTDSKAEYNRTWIQTCNLGIGIFLLSIGIYYQQTN